MKTKSREYCFMCGHEIETRFDSDDWAYQSKMVHETSGSVGWFIPVHKECFKVLKSAIKNGTVKVIEECIGMHWKGSEIVDCTNNDKVKCTIKDNGCELDDIRKQKKI
jgi:hypothetical protein